MGKNIACLDYSVAKGGALVAYRWSSGEELSVEKFVIERAINKEMERERG